MVHIHLETKIAAPPNAVFDMARNVSLHEKGSSDTDERAVAGVTSGLLELGDTVTWRAKHFGVWQELTVVITEMEPPSTFADEMTRGAFKTMRHVHRFEPEGDGTNMLDDMSFQTPFGPIGILAERLFLKRYMRMFLVKRGQFLRASAEG